MRLLLTEPFAASWKDKDPFEEVENLQGEVFREIEARRTLCFIFSDKRYFVKIHYGVGWIEIIKNLSCFRLPVIGAINEIQAIQRLEQLNIETMKIAGYGWKGLNPARQRSFIITEELTDTISLEDYCEGCCESKPEFRLKYALIKKVADISRRMHDNGINHRDFYLCHFLIKKSQSIKGSPSGALKLFLIDLHRAQLRRKTPLRWRLKDIASLYFSVMNIGLTQKDFYRFMSFYSGKSLKKCLTDVDGFWRKVEIKGQRLWQKKLRKDDKIE